MRFANMIPGLGGGWVPNAAPPSLRGVMPSVGAPARTTRMLDGKEDEVGVAGSTLMLLCGERDLWACAEMWPLTVERLGEASEALEVEDALLCVCAWCGMLLMLLTEEEVDLRPRRPPEERRYEERGVWGAGEAERRRSEPEPWVVTRGRTGALWVEGGGCV